MRWGRQRVKDQLSVMAPGEYPQYTIEYEIGAARAPAAPRSGAAGGHCVFPAPR